MVLAGGGSALLVGFARANTAIAVSPTGGDDDDMLDAATATAARQRLPLLMAAGSYRRRSPWRLPAGLELDADPAAGMNAADGCSVGIVVPHGNAVGRSRLPALGLYSDCGLSIEGAALLDLEVPSIGGCGTAIRMTSVLGSLLDNRVRFGAIFSCDAACVIRGLHPKDVIQGNAVEGNFVTTTRSTVIYEGTTCFCDGNRFAFEAVDITQEKGGGGFMTNRMKPAARDPNPNGTFVPRATFSIRNWAGGEGFSIAATGGAAQLIEGDFSDAIFDIRGTRDFLLSNQKQATRSIVNSEIKLHMVANQNQSYHAIGERSLGAGSGLSQFNSGQPVARDSFTAEIDTSPLRTLAVGETADFYVYALFTDVYTSPWFARVTGGAINDFVLVACLDQSDLEDHRLMLRMRRIGSTPAGPSTLQLTVTRFLR